MKRQLLSIAAVTSFCLPLPAAATEIFGIWARDGHPTDKLEFFDCGGKLCAKGIFPMRDGSPPPLVLRYAAKTGPNSWKGDLYNPEDGKTYTGKISFDSPNQLTLSGCLVAFLCQSETWTRLSGPPKAAPPAERSEAKGARAPAAEALKPQEKERAPEKATVQPKPADTAKTAKPAPKTGEPKSSPPKPAPAKPTPRTGDVLQ
jgi:uncharacterized protein (DUF2147 family)